MYSNRKIRIIIGVVVVVGLYVGSLAAQGAKPPVKPAAQTPAKPAGSTPPKPAASTPAKPSASGAAKPTAKANAGTPPATTRAKSVVRTDIVNDTTVTQFTGAQRVAVIAAVGRYDSELAPLQFTMADAVELGEEFKRQGYTVFPLLDKAASAGNIRTRLEAIAEQLSPKDGTLVFVFSGHGFQTDKGTNYLVTYGATEATLEEQGLALPEVEALMKRSGARRNIMMIDACRNLPASKGTGQAKVFRDLSTSEGTRILLSTRPGGVSYEDTDLQHGIFTHFVLEGLRGKAANSDRKITFEDLASYVEKNVVSYAAARSLIQKPFQSGEASGDFLLATAEVLDEQAATKARTESAAVGMSNSAVYLKPESGGESFLVSQKGDQLYLYRSPSMQAYASLSRNTKVKLAPGYQRFDGQIGSAGDVMHAAVRFEEDVPVQVTARIGKPCQVNCQVIPLPGEDPSILAKIKQLPPKVVSIFRRGDSKAEQEIAKRAGQLSVAVDAIDGRSWSRFALIPDVSK